MRLQWTKWMAALAAVAVMAGCSSGVKRPDGAAQAKLVSPKVTQVQLMLSDNAKKLQADNDNFNTNELKNVIEQQLKARGALDASAGQTLEVTVTSFRARSALTAVLFGVMAGTDNVEGSISVKDASGKVMHSAEISASYALGGYAGGITSTRMGWLYEAFAKHVVAELHGETAN